MSLCEWERAWNEAASTSPLKAYRMKDARWDEYWDYIAAGYGTMPPTGVHDEKILEYLRQDGLFSDGDSVLDVGAGPGTFAIPFARDASSVTCVDISSLMLTSLMDSARRSGLSNIMPVRSEWGAYEPESKFDLVFSAFCPGVNDRRSLLKMERLSRKHCCYIAGDASQFRLLRHLWSAVTGEPCSVDAFNVSYPFNILLHADRKPRIRVFSHRTEGFAKPEDVIEEFIVYFNSFMRLDNTRKDKIKEIVYAKSNGGQFHAGNIRTVYAICWNTPVKAE